MSGMSINVWKHGTGLMCTLDLPDAEHVHVTRHPDGTVTAVPMLEFNWRERTADELRGDWWVDAPVEDR